MIYDLLSIVKLPFLKNRELYFSLHRLLGFYPRNINYYAQALRHKSSLTDYYGVNDDNERLEFLGDAVLDAVVGDIVFCRFRNKSEGFLTEVRSKIVQRETLNKIAFRIGLDKIFMSSPHVSSLNNNMLGNAFEAIVGAIYLDRGYELCKFFIDKRVIQRFIDIDKLAYTEVNFTSKLIEWCQKRHLNVSFEVLDHHLEHNGEQIFATQVSIEGVKCRIGTGSSKKESRQAAAKNTLVQLKKLSEFKKMILSHRDLSTVSSDAT